MLSELTERELIDARKMIEEHELKVAEETFAKWLESLFAAPAPAPEPEEADDER
jgi:hypothetical protein